MGTTLVELMVAIAILAVGAGVVTLALPAVQAPPPPDLASEIARARKDAVEQARAVSVSFPVNGRLVNATAHPDGSVVVDSAIVERFTGRAPYAEP